MDTARVTTKGQITIPQRVRQQMGIQTGDVLAFVGQEDGTVVVQKLRLPDAGDVQKRFAPMITAENITEEDVVRGVEEVWVQEFTERGPGRSK
jgi:antitoxin PrlF